MSPGTGTMRPPSRWTSATVASRSSASISFTTTVAPSAARRRLTPPPIPPPPPVTTATRSASNTQETIVSSPIGVWRCGMGRVDDKVVIITGAGEGLGRVMAQLFAREGAQVVLAARRPEPLEETRALVEAAVRDALVVPTDVTDEDAVVRMVEATVSAF